MSTLEELRLAQIAQALERGMTIGEICERFSIPLDQVVVDVIAINEERAKPQPPGPAPAGWVRCALQLQDADTPFSHVDLPALPPLNGALDYLDHAGVMRTLRIRDIRCSIPQGEEPGVPSYTLHVQDVDGNGSYRSITSP